MNDEDLTKRIFNLARNFYDAAHMYGYDSEQAKAAFKILSDLFDLNGWRQI